MSITRKQLEKAILYAAQKPGELANLILPNLAVSAVTTIKVRGAASIQLDAAESVTSTYAASIKDQYGFDMDGTIVWSLKAAVTGVSINSGTGVLTATKDVVATAATVVATIGSVSNEFPVTIVAAPVEG